MPRRHTKADGKTGQVQPAVQSGGNRMGRRARGLGYAVTCHHFSLWSLRPVKHEDHTQQVNDAHRVVRLLLWWRFWRSKHTRGGFGRSAVDTHNYLKGRTESRSVVVQRASSSLMKRDTGPLGYRRMGSERDANEIYAACDARIHGRGGWWLTNKSLGNETSDHQGAGMYHRHRLPGQ